MNNQEYLNTILGKFGVSPDEILILLIEQSIDPNQEIQFGADTTVLKKAVHAQLPLMLAGIQDVSEGGYSVKWNVDGIKLWYSLLSKQLGLPDPLNETPEVTGIKPW